MRVAPIRRAGPGTPPAAPAANSPRLPTGLPTQTIPPPNARSQPPRHAGRAAAPQPREWKSGAHRGVGEAKIASHPPPRLTPPPAPAIIGDFSAATRHPPTAKNLGLAAKDSARNS